MRKNITYLLFFGLTGYLIYGAFLSRYELRILPPKLETENSKEFYDYKGVTNVQTDRSTGEGSELEIINAAQESKLDFIIITDLNDFSRPYTKESYHGNLLVLVDGEYSYGSVRMLNYDARTKGHLPDIGRTQIKISHMLNRKNRDLDFGIFVLAHPFKPEFQWAGEYPPGLDGVEIINLRSIWQDSWKRRKLSFLWSLFVYPVNPEYALIRLYLDPEKEIKLWDQLSQKGRPIIGVAGVDADARLRFNRNRFFKFPSYKALFKMTSNHILLRSELTGDSIKDREKLMGAFRQGQFYMSLDILNDPKGFNAYITDKSGTLYPMGSSVVYKKELVLNIQLPQMPLTPFEIVIYRNGEKVAISNKVSIQFPIREEGVYRAVVRVIPTLPLPDGKRWFPWIYTNSFYITDSK